jgi:hypothetical protein
LQRLTTLLTATVIFAIFTSIGTRMVLMWQENNRLYAQKDALRAQSGEMPRAYYDDGKWSLYFQSVALGEEAQKHSARLSRVCIFSAFAALCVLMHLCIESPKKRHMHLVTLGCGLIMAGLVWPM